MDSCPSPLDEEETVVVLKDGMKSRIKADLDNRVPVAITR